MSESVAERGRAALSWPGAVHVKLHYLRMSQKRRQVSVNDVSERALTVGTSSMDPQLGGDYTPFSAPLLLDSSPSGVASSLIS